MRLPNFRDRRIIYESFLLKNFFNFFKVGVGKGVVFLILLIDLKQLLPSKPLAILYLLKERVANPTPLNKFFKNIIKIKKFFETFFYF